MQLIDFIQENSQPDWMTKETRQYLQEQSPDMAFAFFCPSYKKHSPGFRREIGNTTKHGIEWMEKLAAYIPVHLVFSDVLLEHWRVLTWSDLDDLDSNFISFLSYAQEVFNNDESRARRKGTVAISKLSGITNISIKGERGIVPPRYFKGLIDRERVFYGEAFGWSDNQIIERLQFLAGSYKIMAKYVIDHNGFIVMVESQYERGKLYHSAPVVYPKKL